MGGNRRPRPGNTIAWLPGHSRTGTTPSRLDAVSGLSHAYDMRQPRPCPAWATSQRPLGAGHTSTFACSFRPLNPILCLLSTWLMLCGFIRVSRGPRFHCDWPLVACPRSAGIKKTTPPRRHAAPPASPVSSTARHPPANPNGRGGHQLCLWHDRRGALCPRHGDALQLY